MIPFKKLTHLFHKTINWFWLLGVIVTSGLLHGWNMLRFPFFENDEGTYLAQAWSFLTQGKLAPYTYWYDHAPFGWIFTSGWLVITGGLFRFGSAMNSGRVFMLVIHIASSILLYRLTKRISSSRMAAAIAVILFSISPLAVYFQRRMLLDNLLIFWILITINLIITSRHQLRLFLLSAITFGLAVLSKENGIFFLPVLLWLVWTHAHSDHKRIAVVKWLAIAGAVISIYPLYALLKGELLPLGWPLASTSPHVSLIGTLIMQGSRGSGLPIWNAASDFQVNLRFWLKEDELFIKAGFAAWLFNGILALKSRRSRVVFWLTLPQVLFVASGKLVINFYVISLIPFFSLSIAMALIQIQRLWGKIHWLLGYVALAVLLTPFILYYFSHVPSYLLRDETTPQLQAVEWIKKNVPPQSHISIDFYSYLDLSNARSTGDAVFPNADWFWKIEFDPEITQGKLRGNFQNLQYVMMTAEAQRQIPYFAANSLIRNALIRSQPVAFFSSDPQFSNTYSFENQLQPNGDWVVMYKQQHFDLQKAWETYKDKFMHANNSYVQGPEQRGYVISEAQAYALLRAVWMNDRETFDAVLAWTNQHMKLPKSHLYGWKWQSATGRLIDEGNAPDADQDIALALIFAAKQWQDPSYLNQAQAIITDIWQYNVFSDERVSIVTAGNWATQDSYVTLNPSYFAPYAYRIFAHVDAAHDWQKVVDSSYQVLSGCADSLLDQGYRVHLPPEWCRYERLNGSLTVSQAPQPVSSDYGFNAFRVPWKLYLDYQWNKEERAHAELKKMDFLTWQYSLDSMVDVYSHDGSPQSTSKRYASLMNLPVVMMTDPKQARRLVDTEFTHAFTENDNTAYWYEGDDYYLQNWAWFAAGIYQGELVDLSR